MNVDDENILPSTDLSLALGYSNQCIQRLLNNDDPGTGANAASTLDMTFLATNTLAELVWSPKRGLCLKCADRRFTNQEPSLLNGLETLNMASESSSDKSISIATKPINKGIFMASLAACKLGSEVAREDNSSMLPSSNANIIPLGATATSDQVEEMQNVEDVNFVLKEDSSEFKPDMAQKYPACEEPLAKFKDIREGTHALGMEIVVAPVMHATKEYEASETKVQYAASSGRRLDKMPSLLDEGRKDKTGTRYLLEQMESSAENDLENQFGENALCVATDNVALKSADTFESNIQQDDGLLHADKTVEVKESSSNSKFQKDRANGKSIVLADQDGDRMMLNEEDRDGSNETVESCNSTGQISTGKRKWNFEQTLIVQNKSVKRQIHESPALSSRQDSSFMNWISNMTKGFSRIPEGQAPVCASLSNPNHGPENADQDNKNKELKSTNVGFRSIFRSLYSRKGKGQEAVTLNSDREMKMSKELEQKNNIYDMNATPIACCMGSGTVYNQFLLTSERFNESTSDNQVGPTVHSKNIPMDLAVIRESNTNSTENINSDNVATSKEKDGTSSNFSHGKYNANSVEKVDSEIPFERKTDHDFCFRGDPLQSSWVARYTHRRSGPFRNQDASKKCAGEPLDCADGMKLNPQLQNCASSSNLHENDEVAQKCTQELSRVQNCDAATEASSGPYKIKGQHSDKSDYKLNSILPSSRCNSPEAMASVFARRLDALKHIVSSDDPDTEDYATMTCYFCGIKGHHLRECPEIISSEVEDLVRNFNLYDGVKKMSCVCIRCFQPNHWAVSCPSVCKRLRNEPECDTSLPNQCRPSKMPLDVRNDIDIKQEDTATDALKACYYSSSGMEKDLTFNLKTNEASTSRKMPLDKKKEIASSSEDRRLNQMAPLYSVIKDQISDVPYGVFDAIRSLRLTRTDVLKWLNSNLPVSHLDGLFLRLRLGKWVEGLGGTGYYAAYISGEQMESSLEKSNTSIAVNVGGMKCLVKSQYVSNHDFLEDELRAWWAATSRGGDKIPSEEELRLKVKEKKMLGF